MKKTFTLFLALLILTAVSFSQPFAAAITFRKPAINLSFAHRYVEAYSFTKHERDMQLSKINAAYNQQLKETMDLRMPASKKIDLIQQLQRERNSKIQSVNYRFSYYRNKYNDNHYGRDHNWTR